MCTKKKRWLSIFFCLSGKNQTRSKKKALLFSDKKKNVFFPMFRFPPSLPPTTTAHAIPPLGR